MTTQPAQLSSPPAEVAPLAEGKLRGLLNHLPGLAAYVDLDLTFRFVNRRCEDWLGAPRDAVVGRHVRALLGDDGFRAAEPHLRRALGGDVVRFCQAIPDKAGRPCVLDAQCVPDRAPDGTVEGLYLLATDVTEQREAEETLQQSARRWRSLVENNPDVVMLTDRDTTIRYLNRGNPLHPKESLIGRRAVDFVDPAYQSQVLAHYARAWDSGQTVDFEVPVTLAGETRWHYSRIAAVPREGVTENLVVVGRDITDRKRAESTLAERELMLRTLGDNLPNAVVYQLVVEPDGRRRFTHVSAGVEALSGITSAEALRDPGALYRLIHEDDLSALARAEAEAFARLAPFDVQVRKRLPTGEVRWSHLRSAPRRTPDGRIIWDGVDLDITARKRAEEERAALQRTVHEAQRLESLGVLAGGIAHDFNNLLTGILGNAQLAAQEAAPGSAVEGHLKDIELITLRAADLCQQMLAYAGKGRYVPAAVDLNCVVADLRPLLHALAGAAARLDLQLAPALPPVVGDVNQLQQVLQNLVTNAAEAIVRPPGTITVRTGSQTVDAALLRRHAPDLDLSPGEYAVLAVHDTGGGMTDEVRRRVFEPFFSTKFTGRGLGLAAVQGIVRGHGGFVTVDSEPDQGCRLTVYLPAADPTELRRLTQGA
jgi:PAS domain S-box-containing protein